MKIVEYRAQIERALKSQFPNREFLRPLPHRCLWMVPHVLLIIASAMMITATDLHVAIKLVGSLVIGSSFASLGFLGHEFLHGSIIKKRWLAGLLGGICMSPFAVPPTLWRWWHNDQHHGHTQIYGQDPDASARIDEYKERLGLRILSRLTSGKPFVMLPLIGFWFPVHNFLMLRTAFHVRPKERFTLFTQFALAPIGSAVLGCWIGFGNWLLIHVLPIYVGGFVLMSFIATNHLLNEQTSAHNLDPVTTSLSLRIPWLFRILYLNFNLHTCHHLYKRMSSKYAPLITEIVKKQWPDRYHEMSWQRAVWTLCCTPRLYLDEVTLIDPLKGRRYGVLGHGLDPS